MISGVFSTRGEKVGSCFESSNFPAVSMRKEGVSLFNTELGEDEFRKRKSCGVTDRNDSELIRVFYGWSLWQSGAGN
jgi:hypothetical protein